MRFPTRPPKDTPNGPGGRVPPPNPAAVIARVAHQLERALGGREALIELLIPVVDRPEQFHLLAVLQDPAADAVPLGEILRDNDIPYATLHKLVQKAHLARASVEAMQRVAARLPTVAEQVMDRALAKRVPCEECAGTGTLVDDPTEATPNPVPERCPTCRGKGTLYRDTSVPEQKLALELGGLLSTKAGVQVNVQQDNRSAVASFTGGAMTFADIQRATDALLSPAARTTRGLVTAGPAVLDVPPVLDATIRASAASAFPASPAAPPPTAPGDRTDVTPD